MRRKSEIRPGVFLVNGIAGDPAVFVQPGQGSDGILFDLGSLENLGTKDLLRVDTVLVSHTHIDHFIGFDRLLRVNIPHHRQRLIVGPQGMAERVSHRLQAYTWNLLQPEQIRFLVYEVSRAGDLNAWLLCSDSAFRPMQQACSYTKRGQVCLLPRARGFAIEACVLDHYIDSVAYLVRFPERWRVQLEAVTAAGLSPGPWLGELQRAMSASATDRLINTGNGSEPAGALGGRFLRHEAGMSIGYATDLGFNADNLSRCTALFANAELLIAESSFSIADRSRAAERRHLSSRQSAMLAASAHCRDYESFHVSSVYGPTAPQVIAEAQACFHELKSLPADALAEALATELNT